MYWGAKAINSSKEISRSSNAKGRVAGGSAPDPQSASSDSEHAFVTFGNHAVDGRVHVHDLHATILNRLGIDHTKLTFTHSGRPERLTDPDVTEARVVREILA